MKNLYRSFSIVAPQQYKAIADSIHGANQNMVWYRDNNYPFLALQIIEYGISFCQYSYSLPKVITEFYHLLIMVNYSDYFGALGFNEAYFNPEKNQFAADRIIERIKTIQQQWKDKYPLLDFRTPNLRFDNLINFNHTFTTEIEFLNTDPK